MNFENKITRWVFAFVVSLAVAIGVYFINYEPTGGCDGGLCLFGVLTAFFYALFYFVGSMIFLVNILNRRAEDEW